jgi:hypothetical protein
MSLRNEEKEMAHGLLKEPVDSKLVIIVRKETALSLFQAYAFFDNDENTSWEGGRCDSLQEAVNSVLEGLKSSGEDMLFGKYDPVV